ncbi:MAG: mevalonate kinase [Candidatus Bathyarchaeia archaeon]
MRIQAKASAPAKVILLGEHFVVHGAPAIVLAIDLRATVLAEQRRDKKIYIESKALKYSDYFKNDDFRLKKRNKHLNSQLKPVYAIIKNVMEIADKEFGVNLKIDSDIPVAAGLGSSAAIAVASVAALSHLFSLSLDDKEIFELAFEAEKIIHGNPSGVDPAVSTYGGILRYQKGKDIQKIGANITLPLVIGDTEIKRSTGEMVTHVGEMRNRFPAIFERFLETENEIVARSIDALRNNDIETLGDLMNINHALLYAIGVSNEPLDKLVYAARKAGASGAKITGAGGGGCIVALATSECVQNVKEAIELAGGKAFITKMTMDGVKIEE